MATKKKVTRIKTTTTKTETVKSKETAASFVLTLEKNIVHCQKQLSTLSKLRKTAIQISNGNMKDHMQEPLSEKENTELLEKMKTTLKGLNIKPSATVK